jgi:two-component system cell cycle response regulator
MAAQLRANERIWAGFRDLELRMLAADSLYEILQLLIRDLPLGFPAVHTVTIAWNNPEALVEHIDSEPVRETARTFLVPNRKTPESEPVARRPHLGPVEPASQKQYFPGYTRPLGSMAIAPLFLRGEAVGSLNQGSEDPSHFTRAAATDLLEHLAAVTAICIDNAVNRARLAHQGLTDALTNVGNRRFFEQRLREEVSRWQRRGGDLSCLLVDLDHFKQINDCHGHQVGDLVLEQAARLFSQGLRASDVLARYGGEEFALLLPATGATRAFEIAERLRSRLAGARIAPSPETSLHVTASIGLASLGDIDRRDAKEPGAWLLRHADSALYAAKARGRNSVVGPEVPTDTSASGVIL